MSNSKLGYIARYIVICNIGLESEEIHAIPVQDQPYTAAMDVDYPDDGYEERTNKHRNSHCKRKEKATEAWNLVRVSLKHKAVESWALPVDQSRCYICSSSDVTVRCLDCGAHVYYCEECSKMLHGSINIFHRLFKWKVCSHSYASS